MANFKFSSLIDTLRNSKLNNIGTYQAGLSNKTVDGYEVGLPQFKKVFLLTSLGTTFEASMQLAQAALPNGKPVFLQRGADANGFLGEFAPVGGGNEDGGDGRGVESVLWEISRNDNGESILTITTAYTDSSQDISDHNLGNLKGEKGKDGEKGTSGTNGVNGRGIKSITHTSKEEEGATILVIQTEYSDDTSSTQEVSLGNINGIDGNDGVSIESVTYESTTVNTDNHTIVTVKILFSNSESKSLELDLGILASGQSGSSREITKVTATPSTNDGGTSILFKFTYSDLTSEEVPVNLGLINGADGQSIIDVVPVTNVNAETGATDIELTFVKNEGEDIKVPFSIQPIKGKDGNSISSIDFVRMGIDDVGDSIATLKLIFTDNTEKEFQVNFGLLPSPLNLSGIEPLAENADLPTVVARFNDLLSAIKGASEPAQGA